MKRTTIVRIAEWTGWCGPCAAERPLVLTRTGRHTLRSWLTGSGAAERPLLLTCRLCGIGVVVPSEADDPELLHDEPTADTTVVLPVLAAAPQPAAADVEAAPALTTLLESPVVVHDVPVPAVLPLPAAVDLPVAQVEPAPASDGDLQAGRQAVADALSQLLRQRASGAEPVTPQLPQQRSGEAPVVDGLQALQLLADGLDLLSTPRR